ncbi:MAG TPA: choice-of-anchor tandem repeat GloVer-containing protein [Cyclobacteriaceae bacterium]|nr:choice-of-anchor tandem repeat GloVer-containing protein [Cyclobacteriaceae bacterium]
MTRNFAFLFFCLLLLPALSFAQYSKLLDFGSTDNGVRPYGEVFSDGTFLYGMTKDGGKNALGVIYKVKPNGTGFTTIFDFDVATGTHPIGGLISDGTFLYGMTIGGGDNGQGSVFKIMPDGSGFITIFSFNYFPSGGYPFGSLVYDGNFLYGTTTQGGTGFVGTVFKVKTDGSGYLKLLEFDGTNNGSNPQGSLITDGTFLYGMTTDGGANDRGTAFKVKTDGTGYTKLLDFVGTSTGANPYGSFFSDGTFLYGMTIRGGASNAGVLFKIKPDGTGFLNLLDFNSATGSFPRASLISDGTFLYGTTTQGGTGLNGTIFRIKPDGTLFAKLADHNGSTSGPQPEGTLALDGSVLYGVRSSGGLGRLGEVFKVTTGGSGFSAVYTFEITGNKPGGRPIYDGTFLYGMTSAGGVYDAGTIYKIRPDGTGFTKIFDMDGDADGDKPYGSLISDGTFLYGMTSQGGANDQGTMFKIKTDGTGYIALHDFDDPVSGSYPSGSLISDGTFLYGITAHGGTMGYGVVFKIKLNGTGFVKLLDLDYVNSGAYPNGSLIFDGTFLYALTYQGGAVGAGLIFKIKTDGSGFAKLHEFDFDKGSNPLGSLLLDGTFLYGMTSNSGANGFGDIFKIGTDGTGFATLLDFDRDTNGSQAQGSFISIGGYLYGLTAYGGTLDMGTMFRIHPDGTAYEKMFDFNDGQAPPGSLVSDGTFVYGVTNGGGKNGLGTFFKHSIAPFVSINSFEPAESVIGTTVTIKGTAFDPVAANNIVKFNGTTGVVKTATLNKLTVVVPPGATTGPVAVTAGGGTATSIDDFIVATDAIMFNGTVQNCNVTFVPSNDSDNLIETFVPVNPADKVMVSFSSFDVDDLLLVYDGPDTSYALVATLQGQSLPADITATGPGGELTFFLNWQDASSDWEANISCVSTGPGINITNQPTDGAVCAGEVATFSVTASGAANLTYRWQYSSDSIAYADIVNGGGYSNATTSTLSVNTTGLFGQGLYRCRINGDLATERISDEAGLLVRALPPAPSTVNSVAVCAPASVVVTASGGTNGQYRWYTTAVGGTAISGQVNSSYTTPQVSVSTTYFVSLTDGTCESVRTAVIAGIKACNPPAIAAASATTHIAGSATIDLTSLISDSDNNLDLTTLKILTPPSSGATATLSGLTLTIDYSGQSFAGTDVIVIQVCDVTGLCTSQQFTIEVLGKVVVYNAVSPNGDNKNDYLLLEYIDLIPATAKNQVRIYNRWGDEVFKVDDYNNRDRVFKGDNKNGNKLPSGTYFYKISFEKETLTGYLELKN